MPLFRSKVDDDPGRRYAEAVRTREIMTAASAEDASALVREHIDWALQQAAPAALAALPA